jgi:hypothetical protein
VDLVYANKLRRMGKLAEAEVACRALGRMARIVTKLCGALPHLCCLAAVLTAFGAQEPTTAPSPPPSEGGPTAPPISLSVQNATLIDVAAELSEATGTRIEVAGPAARRNASALRKYYTLAVKQQPFWSTVRQLDSQSAISFVFSRPNQPVDLCIVPSALGLHNSSEFGDFLAHVTGAQRGTTPGHIQLHWVIAVDPRVHVTRAAIPPFDLAVDEAGNQFTVEQKSTEIGAPVASLWSLHAALGEPRGVGKMIALIRGTASFTVELQDLKSGNVATRQVTFPFKFTAIPLPGAQ